jgi:hypothetical protein
LSNLTNSDLSNSSDKIVKQIWPIANKHLVLIDESIIQKLRTHVGDNTIFVEQELRQEDNTIVMRIKKVSDLWKNEE